MKKLYLIFVLILIPMVLFAQYNTDGRRIFPETVGSTQITNGTVANVDLATTAIDGGVCLEATQIVGWFPCAFDSGTVDGLQGTNGWYLDASAPPTCTYKFNKTVFGFSACSGDASGDDIAYLTFVVPYDYESDGMELYLYWAHTDDDGAATDRVEWNASIHSMGDQDTLVHTDSTLTAADDIAASSDSSLYIANIDPELPIFSYGDLVTVKIWADESDCDLDSGEKAYLFGVLVTAEKRDD